jgi:hypothetical protein
MRTSRLRENPKNQVFLGSDGKISKYKNAAATSITESQTKA